MTDERRYTEREVIERERAAFVRGVSNAAIGDEAFTGLRDWKRWAAEAYPLPPELMLREEPDPDGTGKIWRVRDGVLEHTTLDGSWLPAHKSNGWPTSRRVALWADLYAYPYRDADGNLYDAEKRRKL